MPSVLSDVLNKSGYDNAFSIENMNDVEINSIETFVQDHLQLVNSDPYAQMDKFRLLPGHRTFLLRLPEAMKRFVSESKLQPETSKKRLIDSLPLSFLMKEMIHNAISNAEKDPNNRRYSETIQYFATYIYMFCGKACYEILSNNLPIPSVNSICESIHSVIRVELFLIICFFVS